MPTSQMNEVMQHLRRTILLQDESGLTDGQLLGCFIEHRDEAAFAALLRRHGPMVWGVCRRLLNQHDAEDAFQATFLVLVRKAGSVVPREKVANWLYGVAHQATLQARRTNSRRTAREKQVTKMPEPAVGEQDVWRDLKPLFDQELSRLPDAYRGIIVLCDLEGKTRKEAARQLSLPEGTIASRLARARRMLAKRLARHGQLLSGGALAAVLIQESASASVPTQVVASTIKFAGLFAAGNAATGAVSTQVVALTEGVLKAMMMNKIKSAFVLIFAIGILGWTRGIVIWQSQLQAQPESPKAQPMPDLSGTWYGNEWGTVVLQSTKNGEFEGTYSDTFGKDVGRIAVRWSTASRRYEGSWSEGKFRFGRIALEAGKNAEVITGAWTTDPKCEHEPGVPSLASLKWSKKPLAVEGQEKLPQKQEMEAFTAWGKEVNGLQAGLGFRPGEHRAYHIGETVKLVVRVRNVGKKDLKVQYVSEFVWQEPPTVTDANDKPVDIGLLPLGDDRPKEASLAPGKAIELYQLEIDLRPERERFDPTGPTGRILHGPGKFIIQYKRVAGDWSKLDPDLSKLGTGKLELEIKSDPPPPTEKETPQKQDKEEAFTVWGKEVGGLQAGIRLERIEVFNAAANRWEATQTPVGKIHQGSDIIFKVFVRNMGKQEIKLKYIEPSCWLYSEDGRNLKFDPAFSGSRNRFWSEKTLQPSEKWEVGQLNITTRQPKPTESFSGLRLLKQGKFRVSCPTALMQEKGDKLATGEVEIDVLPAKGQQGEKKVDESDKR